MTKIVINTCYGGFGLSTAALVTYMKLQGKKVWVTKGEYGDDKVTTVPAEQLTKQPEDWHKLNLAERQEFNDTYKRQHLSQYDIARDDPVLVQVIEKLGRKANGRCAELKVVEIPDDVKWFISEYDGSEHIAEEHRTWG